MTINFRVESNRPAATGVLTDLEPPMARITVEDCLVKIPNRFQLVLAATYRARMLSQGHAPKIETKNKPGVTALREIAAGEVGIEMLRKVPV